MRFMFAKTALAIIVCCIVGVTLMMVAVGLIPPPNRPWGVGELVGCTVLLTMAGIGTGIAVHLVRKWNGSRDGS